MTSRADVDAFRAATLNVSTRAQQDVARLLRSLDLGASAEVIRDSLVAYLPEIVEVYGEVTAALAADYFADLRDAAGAPGYFDPELAEPASRAQVTASTRWAAGPLFTPDAVDEVALLGRLQKVADRLTKQPGRETFANALANDPAKPRYARIPSGAETCVFCAMLASRGAVYLSEESAGGGAHDFHDHCDCALASIYDGQPLPDGYDPEHYLSVYAEHGGASIDLRRKYDPDGRFVFSQTVETASAV